MEQAMAQQFRPGQIVPESGIYLITHDPQHADMPHEVTVIKGRRFPTCRHCKGSAFELAHAARHVDEVSHLEEGEPGSAPNGHSGDVLRPLEVERS
jgi:YjzC-like protein